MTVLDGVRRFTPRTGRFIESRIDQVHKPTGPCLCGVRSEGSYPGILAMAVLMPRRSILQAQAQAHETIDSSITTGMSLY